MGAVPSNCKASLNSAATSPSKMDVSLISTKRCSLSPWESVGILPYAADDGNEKGQASHLHLDPEKHLAFFAFRFPDPTGRWARTWAEPEWLLPLPDPVASRLQEGAALAPTLREVREPDGTRSAALDFIVEVPVPVPAKRRAGATGARMGLGHSNPGDRYRAGYLWQPALPSAFSRYGRLRWATGPHSTAH